MALFTSVENSLKYISVYVLLATFSLCVASLIAPSVFAATESGSIGIEGAIPGEAPKQAATIAFPRNGASFTELPITVTGICPEGTTVRIFKNNVFGGSAECKNGSYSIKIDLFSGRNELIARVYDDLDQKGPDSETVVVNFPTSAAGEAGQNRISLTSSFAKKGANPGQKLLWPITLSGGSGPYAITIDWGDGKDPDVVSRQFPGVFNAEHIYDVAGTYSVVVRASDKNGDLAFLQLVGVANGEPGQTKEELQKAEAAKARASVVWLPAVALIPLIALAFWLGRRHEVQALRKRLGRN